MTLVSFEIVDLVKEPLDRSRSPIPFRAGGPAAGPSAEQLEIRQPRRRLVERDDLLAAARAEDLTEKCVAEIRLPRLGNGDLALAGEGCLCHYSIRASSLYPKVRG